MMSFYGSLSLKLVSNVDTCSFHESNDYAFETRRLNKALCVSFPFIRLFLSAGQEGFR